MDAARDKAGRRATVKILEREYRIRSDADPAHLEAVASYVDQVLREVRQSTPDTQDASVLAALNIASELLRSRQLVAVPRERILELIELIESA
jgi:cell division protein ZapA (FtsZ GTPase activity inhibitor)